MAPLRNPKHEAFVHNYLKCGDATEAFELTGYTRDSANAHRLLKRPQVQARLRELQDEIAATVPLTIEKLIGELEEARIAAGSKNQFAAAIKAILGKAQLAGLLVDRSKVEVTNTDPFAGMEDPEEVALLAIDKQYEFTFNAYDDYTEADRQHLAGMFTRHMQALFDEQRAYVAEIKARPHKTVTLKAIPSVLNGNAPDNDSQAASD